MHCVFDKETNRGGVEYHILTTFIIYITKQQVQLLKITGNFTTGKKIKINHKSFL